MNKRETRPPKSSRLEAASGSLCAFMGTGANWWNAFDCCGKREADPVGGSEHESYLYGVPEDEAAGDAGFFSEFFTPQEAPLDPPHFNDFFLDPNGEGARDARQPSFNAPDPEQNAHSDAFYIFPITMSDISSNDYLNMQQNARQMSETTNSKRWRKEEDKYLLQCVSNLCQGDPELLLQDHFWESIRMGRTA